MPKNENAERFRELLKLSGITQKKAAELISEHTIKIYPERTIRRWLSNPGCSTHSPCPDWVIVVLEMKLREIGKIS